MMSDWMLVARLKAEASVLLRVREELIVTGTHKRLGGVRLLTRYYTIREGMGWVRCTSV